ncbi:MAG: class I SAM-dependent methyltransferase [Kiritimatiellaeota bacterium]|nr:class I SAM-dependent methyltransferase [Kiritimatiellota bacterium]
MNTTHLNELKVLEEGYWWHLAKRRLLFEFSIKTCPPPARILEVGTGAGGNLLHFKRLGYDVRGFDIMPEAVRYCNERGLSAVSVHDIAEPWPVPDSSMDMVVVMDVLEHLERPGEALKFAWKAIVPGGRIILSVPACPFLMGPWDRALGHFRRYSSGMLRWELAHAGFESESVGYWNLFSLPAAFVVRGAQRFSSEKHTSEFPRVPRWLNKTLLGCAWFERKILRKSPVYYGLSIMGVFRKNESN